MRIVFFGTPDFATASLKAIVEAGHEVVGVVTATDKWGGRGGKQLLESSVKQYAVSQGLTVLQPEKLKNPEFLAELKALNADLQVIVAFRMLPEVVWNMPPLGTFNLHGSLLPRYRGAAPINWAIINGDQETGVTTFFLKHEIDTGDLLFQERLPIGPDDNVAEVHDRMMALGAQLVLKTLDAITRNDYKPFPQDDMQVSHAPKLFDETCKINFEQNALQVHNFVRGLSPVPTAWTSLNDEKLKVFKTSIELDPNAQETIGTFVSDHKNWLKVRVKDGYIHLLDLQLQGRKRLDVKTFLNGYKLEG